MYGGGGGHYDGGGGGAGNANSLFGGGGFMPSQSTVVPESSGFSKVLPNPPFVLCPFVHLFFIPC
jgi:hypothetical protein